MNGCLFEVALGFHTLRYVLGAQAHVNRETHVTHITTIKPATGNSTGNPVDTHTHADAQRHVQLSKQAWRRWAKATRKHLPLEARSHQVCQVLAAAPRLQSATHILAYLPTAHELNLLPLLTTWQQLGKHIYVTRTWLGSYTLTVHRLELDALELHRYGYWQPPARATNINPQQLDVALVPGLCFDRQGQRLGYGAGYFDRLLARCNALSVGVTCSELLIQHIPHEVTDVPMDYLATEQELIRPS